MTSLSDVKVALAGFADSAVDEASARVVVRDLENLFDFIENKLAKIGVKHQIDISLGDYGNGRSLILNEEDASQWYGDYNVGDWLPSSATC